MEKRYQVFVSSTYADLKEERQKVMQTLMEMDCIPSGMELFPAADEEQFEFIKRVIDDCDYYILIISGRYGSIDAEGISFTEKEYDYAISKGLKVIALLHKQPELIPMNKTEEDTKLRKRLQTFRDKVQNGRLVRFWNSANELPGLVSVSLAKTIKVSPALGWVRDNKIPQEDLLREINELRKENNELQRQIQEAEGERNAFIDTIIFSWIEGSPTSKQRGVLTLSDILNALGITLQNFPDEDDLTDNINGILESMLPSGIQDQFGANELLIFLEGQGYITTYPSSFNNESDETVHWGWTQRGENARLKLKARRLGK